MRTTFTYLPLMLLFPLAGCQLVAGLEKKDLPPIDADADADAADTSIDPDDGDDGPDGDGPVCSCEGSSDCNDANPCNGVETCNTLSHCCEPGPPPADGFVCSGSDPRRICLDGECRESACGDGFVDTGAGESCEPPGEGRCSGECRQECEDNTDCPDDGEACNGEEYCDTGAGQCYQRDPLDDGTVCGAAPRRICIGRTCQESTCGDGFVDEGASPAEDCEDGNTQNHDGCDNDCSFSCLGNDDCVDEHACTGDSCDTESHACSHVVLSRGVPCRPAAGDCDAGEECTGTEEDCPADSFVGAGIDCDDRNACTIHDACDGEGGCAGTPAGLIGIEAAFMHTCAVTAAGGVKCWGDNGLGQLGNGTMTDALTPADVSGLASGAASVDTFEMHACAVMSTTGRLTCWGYNSHGQLGDGTTMMRTTPIDVPGMESGVASVAAGYRHTCALLITGGVRCWGSNEFGQLGDGTTMDRHEPVDITALGIDVTAIAAGYDYTCAIMSGGSVMCWGRGGSGRLGAGSTDDSHVPQEVVGLGDSGADTLALGFAHTCARTADGPVMCWGSNEQGQLGDGSNEDRHNPVTMDAGGGTQIDDVAAGFKHTCVLTDAGAMKCTGNNENGQLGDGTHTDRSTIGDVIGMASGVVMIAACGSHSCAITDAGEITCWGWNDHGQLGDGTTEERTTPVGVVGLCE